MTDKNPNRSQNRRNTSFTRTNARRRIIDKAVQRDEEASKYYTKQDMDEYANFRVEEAKSEIDASHEATNAILRKELEESGKRKLENCTNSPLLLKMSSVRMVEVMGTLDFFSRNEELQTKILRDLGFDGVPAEVAMHGSLTVDVADALKLTRNLGLEVGDKDTEVLCAELSSLKCQVSTYGVGLKKRKLDSQDGKDSPSPKVEIIPAPPGDGPAPLDYNPGSGKPLKYGDNGKILKVVEPDDVVSYRFFEYQAIPLEVKRWVAVLMLIIVWVSVQLGLRYVMATISVASYLDVSRFASIVLAMFRMVSLVTGADFAMSPAIPMIFRCIAFPLSLIIMMILGKEFKRCIKQSWEKVHLVTLSRHKSTQHSKDLRADMLSITDMLHKDPLISSARHTITISFVLAVPATLITNRVEILRIKVKTIEKDMRGGVSHELLSQIAVSRNIKWGTAPDVALQRLTILADKMTTVNLNRYQTIQKQHIVQNTVFAAYAMFLDQEYECRQRPFPAVPTAM